jgi:hypothetical protein
MRNIEEAHLPSTALVTLFHPPLLAGIKDTGVAELERPSDGRSLVGPLTAHHFFPRGIPLTIKRPERMLAKVRPWMVINNGNELVDDISHARTNNGFARISGEIQGLS